MIRTYAQVLEEAKDYFPPQPKVKPKPGRSFAEVAPEHAALWNEDLNVGITPDMFTARCNVKVAWKCAEYGHIWISQIADKTAGKSNCTVCSNHVIMTNFNDFPTTHPEVMIYWDYENAELDPATLSYGSNEIGTWKCPTCDHRWKSPIREVVAAGTRCPACAGHVVVSGQNDLATIAPFLVPEFDLVKNFPLTPSTVLAEGKSKLWWTCRVCSHSWPAIAHPRIHREVGCPKCKMAHSKIQKRLYEKLRVLGFDQIELNQKLDVKWNKRYSISWIDIYIEHGGQKYVVEYDGGYWHDEKLSADSLKTVKLIQAGYRVIRVRDTRLSDLTLDLDDYLHIPHVGHHKLDKIVAEIGQFVRS